MNNQRINILHLIQGLKIGGAEVLLLHYIEALGSVNYRHYVYYFGPKGSIAERLKDLEVIIVKGKNRNKINNPIRFIRSHYKLFIDLIKFIRGNKISVLISHLGQANQLGVIVGKFSRIPAFPTVHNTMAFVDRRKWCNLRKVIKKIIDNIIYRIADRVLVVSNEIKDIVKNTFYIKSSKIVIVKNGIIFNERLYYRMDLSEEFKGPLKEIKIIAVGSLIYQKAMDVLIKGADELIKQKFLNFTVLIVGEGEERKQLQILVKKLKLEQHIKFLGLRNDVINLIKSCDIFVMPSRYEGLSVAMIEAMACGIPIIASDAPGLRHHVVDGQNGLLFPVDDQTMLATKILKLIKDKRLRAHVSKGARKAYENEYDMLKNIKTLDKLLSELVV